MKSKKKHAPLKKSLYEYISGRSYKPLSLKEIFQRLNLPKDLHLLGEKALNELVEEEKIYFKKDKIYPSTDSDTIEGIIHIHPRGFGFVIPEDKKKSLVDVFIPRHLTKGAVHGDKVLASINPQSNSDKGPEGKVLSILNRGKKHLCGTVKEKIDDEDYLVHSPLFGSSKEIHVSAPKSKPLKLGDRVYVEILEWGEESDDPIYCKLKKLLGHISDPSIDVQAACLEYDLRVEFPKEVKAEAEKFSTTVTKKDIKDREDFSSDITITIDPKTAKDFDDALSIRKDKNGKFHLGVHIADVAHYVQSGSELDHEAVLRGNSTYFPGTCVPMLPEELSNGLCSLKEGVKRLTISVLMQFDSSGHLQHFDIVRSVIKSSKRFTYEEAKAILDGKKKSKFSPQLKLMEELCLLLKKRRYDRGGVDFALPDLFINLDKKGAPISYEILEYDISHQLVEEFMLKSNEIVATHLVNQGKKLVFRIHEAPSSSDLETFYSLARVMGFNLPAQPSQQDIQTLFGLAKQTPHAHQLSIAFIRSMRLAYYSPNNVGHYGLALENYCHFTSPIRRYPDLIIQRLLFDHESIPHIEEIALKCSEKERLSFRAESSVTLLKKLRLLQLISEQEPDKLFEAKVSRVKPHGMYFELVPLMIEGFIHISKLGDDFFIYNPDQEILRGNLSGQTFETGKQIFVKLISVDLIFLDTKWHLDQNSSWIAKPKRRSKKKSSRRPTRKKEMILTLDFFQSSDVVGLSQSLIGKILITYFDGVLTSGKIVETEAYKGPEDKASHAYNNRKTLRTKVMFEEGGRAYVYLCYGMHSLFNIVTGPKDTPHAILIRAIEPLEGIPQMLNRRKKNHLNRSLTAGPGSLAQALGINRSHSGLLLKKNKIWIENALESKNLEIISSPRVGIDYAKEDALLPWRFRLKGSLWTSK